MSGHTPWRDIKRADSGPNFAGAPTLMVRVERDGSVWHFEIPDWDLHGQAATIDQVEGAARDLIGMAVGLVIVDADEDGAPDPA
jgi:hypothetical protein